MLEALAGNTNSSKEDTGPVGQVEWSQPGTYEWICPEDVTSVCCVVVAAGQIATYPTSANTGKAGDGGGLRWKNDITVIPGTTYQIVLGQHRRSNGSGIGDLAYNATFTDIGNVTTSALGLTAGAATAGTPFENGVGGGYGGLGNNAGQFSTGGSSGGYTNGTTRRISRDAYPGHGVDLYGNDLTNAQSAAPLYPSDGASLGGGGQSRNANNFSDVKRVRSGGRAGVRIMWGRGRSYPNNAADVIT